MKQPEKPHYMISKTPRPKYSPLNSLKKAREKFKLETLSLDYNKRPRIERENLESLIEDYNLEIASMEKLNG